MFTGKSSSHFCSPKDFCCRLNKNDNIWKNTPDESLIKFNYEDEVTLVYFTNTKGKIWC